MSKIVLLFLFCAISGYGINGHSNDPIISPQQETTLVPKVAISATNLNDTTLSSHQNEKIVAPQTVSLSNNTSISSNATAAEPSIKSTVSNVNIKNKDTSSTTTQIVEEVPTNAQMNKSVPMAAINSSKAVIDNISTESPISTVPSVFVDVTTVSPITTKASVEPVPDPKAGKWILTNNNQSCIIVNVALQFHVSYMNKSNNITTHEVFNLPDNANKTMVTGVCGKLEQNITLSWNNTQNETINVNFHFIKNDTKHSYSLHHMELVLLNLNNTVTLANNTFSIPTSLNNSYRCLKQQNYTLVQNGSNNTMGYFILSDLQFEAFKTDNTKNFGTVEDCKLDTPDIVPIAVGCALAGLVVIMLIAYLMGRKRSQASSGGYSSM